MNRLATEKRSQVIAALVEGTSINATCRMTGVAKHTVLKLLKDLGCACAAYPRYIDGEVTVVVAVWFRGALRNARKKCSFFLLEPYRLRWER